MAVLKIKGALVVMNAMISSASGLRVHMTKMDVIANNIANVNTKDFQSSRVTLQDSFSQTIQQARQARNGNAGTNPMQVGSGVSLASIDRLETQGAMRIVDGETEVMSNTDLAVEITTMITTQRAFEANARVIPVADSMLEELVNLKA